MARILIASAIIVALTTIAAGQAPRAGTLRPPLAASRVSAPSTPTVDDSTPWQFFRKNVGHADSVVKWLAVIFFTILLMHFYALLALPVVVVTFLVMAVIRPQVRRSRLARTGFCILLLGGMPLLVVGVLTPDNNALGLGFLFAFATPTASLLIVVGMVLTLFKSDKAMNTDIAELVTAARRSRRIWPDDGSLWQVELVARHGTQAGPALVSLLRFESDKQFDDETWNVQIEQQTELALCKAYGVAPVAGKTVFDVRSTSAENGQIKEFWKNKVGTTRN